MESNTFGDAAANAAIIKRLTHMLPLGYIVSNTPDYPFAYVAVDATKIPEPKHRKAVEAFFQALSE